MTPASWELPWCPARPAPQTPQRPIRPVHELSQWGRSSVCEVSLCLCPPRGVSAVIHFLLPDRWGARESVTLNLPPQPRKRSAPSQLPKSPGGAAPSGGGLRGGVGVGSRGFSSKGPPLGAGRCWRILTGSRRGTGEGEAIMPTDQGSVTEKDSLPRGDRARALEADPQRSASRSFSHCSCSLTLDP